MCLPEIFRNKEVLNLSGIAVISKVDGNSIQKLKSMLVKIKHRGPDTEEIFPYDHFSAGYCHLATSNLPCHEQISEDPLIMIDGRLFFSDNRDYCLHPLTIKQKLINLYHNLGPNMLTKIDGEFVILTFINNTLLLARDPLGIKPLYYGSDKESFYFASEIKALIGFVGEIKEFPPGCYWTPQTGFKKYSAFTQTVDLIISDEEEAKHAIRQSLKTALRIRLPEKEKIGVLLSGGLDSSIIAALTAEITPEIAAFTAGLPESSDLSAARLVAQHLGIEHHEVLFSETQLLDFASKVIYHLESFDLPLVRSSLANFLVSKLAKENGVKVVCVGEGADELFGGYHYLKDLPEERVNIEMMDLISNCRKGGFQRVDRINAANSIEPLIPFADCKLVDLAQKIPMDLKIRGTNKIEKWILREAFSDSLPSHIVKRVKEKFYQGSGLESAVSSLFEMQVDTDEYEKFKMESKNVLVRNKEEFYYYKIFRQFYPEHSILESIHQTKNI